MSANGDGREQRTVLPIEQAVRLGGDCVYVSMISEEAVEIMGLSCVKQAKRIIKGLGGVTTVSKGSCTLTLVARNGDRRTVTAWEVGEIASLPGGQPPEDVDEQFPGLRYLSKPNCLIQKEGRSTCCSGWITPT
jgi:hypothetical protein